MHIYRKSILQPRKKINTNYLFAPLFLQEISSLVRRLIIQTQRRPSSLISGIIQPLLWLILFGALFQNAPVGLFTLEIKYGQFLSSGIIIFTSFTGSLNAGLPLIFDREFGFLNRILVSPIISKDTLLWSSSLFITTITMLQTFTIVLCSFSLFNYNLNNNRLYLLTFITLLITSSISSISIGLAFILPGHIEFLALMLIINLPMLFSSTALAPLSFMPYWLQIIASLNPLTYGIESIRFISMVQNWDYTSTVIKTIWIKLTLIQILFVLIILTAISFISIKTIISDKFE
uniref:ABC-2 type transporter n=1 Tax=Lithothamnion corallioides TaxID=1277934 RepID=UPI0023F23D24|nr:ABC-2 type transporter [Lithothamnion corallioides]WEA77124.1 ABC-2 type transporter [Lithothamnion corallioides]